MAYNYNLAQFYKSCTKATVQEINQQDLLDFVQVLRGTGVGNTTIHNKIAGVAAMLRASGPKDEQGVISPVWLAAVKQMLRNAQVKVTKKIVRSYRPDEIKALFEVATAEERLLMQFMLSTGARDAEIQHAKWSAIDFKERIFYIREMVDFRPKDAEEREVTLPDFLVQELAKRRETSTSNLIFPAKDGGINQNFLRVIKRVAKRAGLVGDFGCHIFRKSYATLLHRAGTDAKTIQRLLGHSSITTTLAYLEGESARSEHSRAQSDKTFGAFA